MNRTIFNKIRPKRFDEFVGLNKEKIFLKSSILDGNLSNSYIFYGPKGSGKTTLSMMFAKAINCESFSTKQRICDECLQNDDIDIIFKDAASNRGINEITNILSACKYPPIKHKYKILVLDEAHMLTNDASNKMLEIVERPPMYLLFIFVTTRPDKIISTIRSRSQAIRFFYHDDEIKSVLTNYCSAQRIVLTDSEREYLLFHANRDIRQMLLILEKMLLYKERRVDANVYLNYETIVNFNYLVQNRSFQQWYKFFSANRIVFIEFMKRFVSWLIVNNHDAIAQPIMQHILFAQVNTIYFNDKIYVYYCLKKILKNII